MSFTIVPDPKVEATFRKMWQKDSARFGQVEKKLRELAENPEIGKPLKKPLRGLWRLHIGHYVLIYRIARKNQKITLVDYAHHDEVY
jgi:addiction module RelE/StbE family toxin